MSRCETCGGGGWRIEFRTYAGEAFAGEPYEVPCPDCDGEEDEPLCQGCDRPLDPRGFCHGCDCFLDDDDGLTEPVRGDPFLRRVA